MAIKSAIEIWCGEDVVLPFDVDEDIAGWTMSLIISDQLQDATPLLTKAATITTAATGLCEVSLTKAQTATLAPGVYSWEFARTNVGAETPLAFGSVTVLPRVGA